MNRHMQLYVCLAAILVLLMTSAPRPVRADGGVFPPSDHEVDVEMPSQRAIIVWDAEKGHEDLILSVELHGGPEAAWVVPSPSLPEVKVASPRWFDNLAGHTSPRIEERVEYYPVIDGVCIIVVEVEVETEAGVELVSREEVGVYDVSILSADEPGVLLDWLNENGYAFPEEGGPILDAYVEEGGWYFVAARVLPEKSAYLGGDARPLWFSFDAEQPIYPMRLTALLKRPVDVLIYALADHRMIIQPHAFMTQFAGELALSEPSVDDADLVTLLTHRPYYVTKLRHGGLVSRVMTEDFYFEQADSDESYRQVTYRTRYECPPASEALTEHAADERPGDGGWLLLGGGLALLGLLAGLALVWRRSRGKSDEEPEA